MKTKFIFKEMFGKYWKIFEKVRKLYATGVGILQEVFEIVLNFEIYRLFVLMNNACIDIKTLKELS